MVLLESLKLKLGENAHAFSLPGIDGKIYTLDVFNDKKVLVVVFMCNHCPYVQAVWKRLIALQEKYQGAVQFVGINSNVDHPDYSEETLEMMKIYSEKYGMNFPYLADATQSVAQSYQAQCTPDIFVYDGERKLAYHGRIDDNWKDESAVTKHELDEALQVLVNGGKVSQDQYPSMGCSLKWK